MLDDDDSFMKFLEQTEKFATAPLDIYPTSTTANDIIYVKENVLKNGERVHKIMNDKNIIVIITTICLVCPIQFISNLSMSDMF